MKEYRFKLHLPNLRGINSGIFDSQKYFLKKEWDHLVKLLII